MMNKKLVAILMSIAMISPAAVLADANYDYINDYFKTLNTEKVISTEEVEWVQFAPGTSGDSDGIFVHPTDDNFMYSFPDMNNSYMSDDGGLTWTTVLDHDQSLKHQFTKIYGMDFSRQDDTFGMASSSGGIRITTDKGRSFGEYILNDNIETLTVHPHDDNIWFAGSGDFWNTKSNHRTDISPHGEKPNKPGKLYKTTDKGKTWKLLNNTGIHPKAEFGGIYIYPEDTNLMFATTTYGLYKSIDGGNKWEKIESIEAADGESADLVTDMDVYIDPQTKKLTLYAINLVRYTINPKTKTVDSSGGILKSHDLGKSWENITGDLGLNLDALNSELSAAVRDVFVPYNEVAEDKIELDFTAGWYMNPNYIKAMFTGNWFLGNWFEKSPQLKGMSAAKAIPNLPTHFLQNYDNIEVDPTNPDRIYLTHPGRFGAGMFIGDVWTTADGGEDWYIAARGGAYWPYPSEYWQSVDQDQHINVQLDHSHEYATEVYPASSVRDFDLNSKGEAYALFRTLYKSEDNGEYWQNLDSVQTEKGGWIGTGESNLPGKQIITDPRDPNMMLMLAGENGIFSRVDDAEKWYYDDTVAMENFPYSPPNSSIIAISPEDINTMYALILRQTGQGEFQKSVDGGRTWSKVSQIFKTSRASTKVIQKGLIIDPNDYDTMYFGITATNINEVPPLHGTEYSGVYKTTDEGVTWSKMNNGLPGTFDTFDLEFDPRDSNVIYAAVSGGNKLSVPVWKKMLTGTVAETFEIKDLMPNTEYFISAYAMADEGESAVMSVVDIAGEVLGSKVIANTVPQVEGVFFTTGADGKAALKFEKTSGDGNVLFDKITLRTAGGLYRTTDAAESWAIVEEFPKIVQVNNIVADAENGKLYVAGGSENAGPQQGGVWVGDLNGTNWKKIFELPKVVDIKLDPYNADRILVHAGVESSGSMAYNVGIYLSEDAGESWAKINNGLGTSASIYDFSFDPDPANTDLLWLTSSAGGFYKGYIGGAPEREEQLPKFTVTITADGETTQQEVPLYSKIMPPPVPENSDGAVFKGWYIGDEKQIFNTPVIGDMDITLTSKWIETPEDWLKK